MAKYINNGVTSTGVTLNDESMFVSSGGTARQTTVNENGELHIENGGIAFDTTVNQYGWVEVLSGGTAISGAIRDGGWFEVFPGGKASQIHVSSGGVFYVSSGGTASDTVFSAGGSGTTVNNGGVFVNTSIGMGGLLGILHGGTANGVNVASNGTFYVSEGGKLTGSMTFETGAFVAFFDSPYLDFDITGRNPSDPSIVNDLSQIKGTPQYTLTVNGSEPSGTYKLASGALGFNQTITVKDTSGATLGTIKVGGALSTVSADYAMSLIDGTIELDVYSKFVDTVPPLVSNVAQDKTAPTNQSVTVTATFSDNIGVSSALYKIGNNGWLDYPAGGVVVSENGTVYFKAVDTAGNESEVISHTVTNIYKGDDYGLNHSFAAAYDLGTDSSIKSVTDASIATAHEEDYFTFKLTQKGLVTLTTSGAAASDTVLYLYDGDQIQIAVDDDGGSGSYSSLSRVLNPGTYYVKVIAYGEWTIDDYDLTVTVGPAPADTKKPVVSNVQPDTTYPTRYNVIVTADFTDDYMVESKLYRIGDGAWLAYPDGGVAVSENATIYFKAIDAGGMESDIVQYTVGNIDRIAPTIEVTMSTTKPTPSVLLTGSFSDNLELISVRYRIDDGEWVDFTPGGVTVTENCDVSVLALDAAGNETVKTCQIRNIDKAALKGEPDDGSNDNLYDKENGWNDSNIHVSNTVTGDGEINLDKAGSVDMDGKHNMFGDDGINTDSGDVAKLNLPNSAKLTFTIDSTAAGTFYVYEDGFDKKGNRTQITVGKVAVKAGKTAELKNVCLTGNGTYYVAMVAKSVKKDGFYNVNVSDSKFFVDADSVNNDEAKDGKKVTVGRSTGAIVVDKSSMKGSTEFKNFVGFDDDIDYAKIDLASSAYLRFSLTGEGDGTAKFTIWKCDTAKNNKMSKVGGVTTLNAKNKYAATTKAQFLDSNNGRYEYYISMACSDAAKGKCVYYNVAVADGAVFFDSVDNGKNNVLYDKKGKAFYGEDDEHHFVSTNVGAGTKTVKLDDNAIGEAGYGNFVGYGDAADYAKINLTTAGSLSFKLKATGDATFAVYKKGQDKKGRDTLVTILTTKLKLAKGANVIDKFTDVLSDLAAGEYYISMTAKNTKANEKGLVYYNVTATLEPPDALALPETSDSLAMPDALSLGQYGTDAPADAAAFDKLAAFDSASAWQTVANLA